METNPNVRLFMARASYAEAVEAYINPQAKNVMRSNGEKAWPALKKQWHECLNG